MTIEEFRKEHILSLDYLLDDTWLCKEPIPVEETKAWWNWMLKVGIESEEDFEKAFGITFEELTNWWNEKVLKV